MTYIIAEPCIDIKDRSCVDVCPVDCIHEFERIVRGLRARVPGRCDLPRGRPPRQVGGVCADQLRVPRPREDQRARRRLRRRAQRPERVRSKHVRRTRTPRSRPRCTSARQRSARTSRTSSRSWGCATAFRRSCWPMSPASYSRETAGERTKPWAATRSPRALLRHLDGRWSPSGLPSA
jgi:NAD-dependent dihydropyrimidine dehydrogenase PreA subunit